MSYSSIYRLPFKKKYQVNDIIKIVPQIEKYKYPIDDNNFYPEMINPDLLIKNKVFDLFRRFAPHYFSFSQSKKLKNKKIEQGFQPIWKDILKIVRKKEDFVYQRLDQLNQYILSSSKIKNYITKISHGQIKDESILRELIGVEKRFKKVSYESLIITWGKGASTPIHGHPPISFYKVLSGKFRMHFYSSTKQYGKLIYKGYQDFSVNESIYKIRKKHHYCHFIHKVECLEPGATFHLYSGNAQRGVAFS